MKISQLKLGRGGNVIQLKEKAVCESGPGERQNKKPWKEEFEWRTGGEEMPRRWEKKPRHWPDRRNDGRSKKIGDIREGISIRAMR